MAEGRYFFNSKNLFIWLLQVVILFLVGLGIMPREAVLISAGLMFFYFIFAPLDDSIWLFVASIPLFTALPITAAFDQMAGWRPLLIVLFLVWGIKSIVYHPERKRRAPAGFFSRLRLLQNDKTLIAPSRMANLVGIFLAIACLSLLAAGDVWAGVKKIIFLVNIFLLFLIIRNFSERNKDFIYKLVGAIKVAAATVLAVGFGQLIAVFFIPLHTFWKFWAGRIITLFYGQALGNVLSVSNTWFSYYAYQEPTLRMFSIFPDSHSFALFCVIALPFFLIAVFLRPKGKKYLFLSYIFLTTCLLAILFSGSRGFWASALGVLIVYLFFILLTYSPTLRSKKNFFITKFSLTKDWWRYFQLCIGSLIILMLLLPISSRILFIPQEMRDRDDVDKVFLFERMKSIIDFSEVSVKSRLQIWQRSADSIMMKPILGVGIGNYPVILREDISLAKQGSSAHNLYLDIASEMGIFALLVFLALFWQIFKDSWIVLNCSLDDFSDKELGRFFKYWAGFFTLALIWILGYSLFDVVLLNDKVFLFFVANLTILYAARSSISFNKYPNL